MRILIINQHTSNRGDESAGKALIRRLVKEESVEEIHVLYSAVNELKEEEKFCRDIKSKKIINHPTYTNFSYLEKVLLRTPLFLPYSLERKIFDFIKTEKLSPVLELIERADKIINAPGGVNLGPYRDRKYLWRLFNSVYAKDTAVYSISFGPFYEDNFLDKRFKKVGIETLKKAKFVSLRDKQSQRFAEEYGIEYVSSIDTAFLDEFYEEEFPPELSFIKKLEYIVFVPNELYRWHVYFKSFKPEEVDNLYLKIMEYFLNKGLSIVMLPQLFGQENDYTYFLKLKSKLKNKNVYVLNDTYSSDIQQLIIRNSLFLVGARYHSVIFAIRNKVPFVSLSYEHKMTNTLELLGLEDLNIELKELIKKEDKCLEKIKSVFERKEYMKGYVSEASEKASFLAKKTYNIFRKNFLNK